MPSPGPVRPRRRGTPGKRRTLVAVTAVVAAAAATTCVVTLSLRGAPVATDAFPAPSQASLSGLTVPQRIVVIAESQVGYRTAPSSSYCNKYSAYWGAGTGGCPRGETAEEWCADFAAWVWQEAGVPVTYGYDPGELNGAAVSFYEWGVANGAWHPVTSGYVPSPGDVAVYGLSLGADPSAAHVAIVIADPAGQPGPNVVNGDGDRTGFSVVETGTDEVTVEAGHVESALAGYVGLP
jgi:hypothetical protein